MARTDQAVLGHLVQGPVHPYEPGRLMRDRGDDRSAEFAHGSLCTVFGRLTAAGRAEPEDWMRELVAEPRHEYPRFGAAPSTIAACP